MYDNDNKYDAGILVCADAAHTPPTHSPTHYPHTNYPLESFKDDENPLAFTRSDDGACGGTPARGDGRGRAGRAKAVSAGSTALSGTASRLISSSSPSVGLGRCTRAPMDAGWVVVRRARSDEDDEGCMEWACRLEAAEAAEGEARVVLVVLLLVLLLLLLLGVVWACRATELKARGTEEATNDAE